MLLVIVRTSLVLANMNFSTHVDRWSKCTLCQLHKVRRNVVLARGKLPCDVLMIGEAPGQSEDVLGAPFTGPAGQLLDRIIAATDLAHSRIAFTNLVACLPADEKRSKVGEPNKESIEACSDRLEEMIEIADPYHLVAVGQLSEKWLPKLFDLSIPVTSVPHPAAILRSEEPSRSLLVRRCQVALEDVAESLVPF